MVRTPSLDSVQVRFSPQVPDAVSSAQPAVGSMVSSISAASSQDNNRFIFFPPYIFSRRTGKPVLTGAAEMLTTSQRRCW